jgi:hypothetical protein
MKKKEALELAMSVGGTLYKLGGSKTGNNWWGVEISILGSGAILYLTDNDWHVCLKNRDNFIFPIHEEGSINPPCFTREEINQKFICTVIDDMEDTIEKNRMKKKAAGHDGKEE